MRNPSMKSVVLPFSATGVPGKGELGVVACSGEEGRGRGDATQSWRRLSVARIWLPTQDAGWRQHQTLTLMLRQVFINLHRLLSGGLAVALYSHPAPSGFVLGAPVGGRRLSPGSVSGDEGLDCFPLFRLGSVL